MTTGLKKETSAALAYVLGPVTGVIFLIIEKDPFVRFHAMQSIVTFIGLYIIQKVFIISIILIAFAPVVSILMFVLWLLLIYKAWMGENWEVPVFGKFAKKLLKKA
jgi:uncharacterized membrane protein